jgi:Protein of unknown function (DUF3667)
MSQELEIAAVDALGGFVRPKGEAHGVCANCGTALQGPWCHACGQSAEDFHRSSWKLFAEVIEGLLHMDGRVWRTLPSLMFRPGRLTRAYLDGHRAPQIPPLRLFLVVLLLVFFVGSLTYHGPKTMTTVLDDKGHVLSVKTHKLTELSDSDKAAADKAIDESHFELNGKSDPGLEAWVKTQAKKVRADPEKYMMVLEKWSERFAFMLLPLSAILMSIVYVFQRRFYFFDHIVFSLHSLSAQGLIVTLMMALSPLIGSAVWWLLPAMPVHLFVHMRGTYGSSWWGTLLRM